MQQDGFTQRYDPAAVSYKVYSSKKATAIKARLAKLSGPEKDLYIAKELSKVESSNDARKNAAKQIGVELTKEANKAIDRCAETTDKKSVGVFVAAFTVGIFASLGVATLLPFVGLAMFIGTSAYMGHEAASGGQLTKDFLDKRGFFKKEQTVMMSDIERSKPKDNKPAPKTGPTSTAGNSNARTKNFSSAFPDIHESFNKSAHAYYKRPEVQSPALGAPTPITLSQTDVARLEAMEKAGLITPGTVPTATRYDGAKIQVIRPAASAPKV